VLTSTQDPQRQGRPKEETCAFYILINYFDNLFPNSSMEIIEHGAIERGIKIRKVVKEI